MDDDIDDMMDIAEEDSDVLVVWFDRESYTVDNGKNSISKHSIVVLRSSTNVFDDDETEWSRRWHVSKQYGRWP